MKPQKVIQSTERLKVSSYCHRFTKNSTDAWYHSLGMDIVFVDRVLSSAVWAKIDKMPLREFLDSLPDDKKTEAFDSINRLRKHGLLVNFDKSETTQLIELKKKFLSKPAIGLLYLILTDQCNFRCKYCFIENALSIDHRFSSMTQRTAKDALDAYSRLIDGGAGRKTIIFYGGEPLMNQTVLRFCLDYIKDLKEKDKIPKNVAVTINTNGSLVNKEIARLFSKHKVAVSVSIDGPQEIHNQYRIFQDERGTFEQTLNGFNLLKKEGVEVGISCTVGHHNLSQLPQITEWFIEKLGIKFLGLNPLIDLPNKKLSSERYIKEFSEAAIKSFLIARQAGLYEDRMMRKVEAFVKQEIYPFDCAGCGRQIVVLPSGAIGVCHAYTSSEKYFLRTDFAKFNPSKENVWNNWCGRSPLGMPQCINCSALGICGGGCPFNAYVNHGSIWKLDDNFCIYAKRVLEWLIWDVFDQMN